jgi:Ankyrin repeat
MGTTPLHMASWDYGHAAVLSQLLAVPGINVNAPDKVIALAMGSRDVCFQQGTSSTALNSCFLVKCTVLKY